MKLKFVAYLVVYLVIFIPISSSFALASISSASISGQDNLGGFSKGDGDSIKFETILISEDNPNLSEIGLNFQSYDTLLYFSDNFCTQSSCTALSDDYPPNSYLCTCETDWDTNDKHNIIFSYMGDSELETLNPDYESPIFLTLDTSQNEGNIVFEYSVKDSACSDCGNKCAGIKEIEVIETSSIKTINISGAVNDCTVSGDFEINYTEDGTNEFTLIVRDNLWSLSNDDAEHSSIRYISLSTDFTKPIISDDLTILKNDNEVDFISAFGITDASLQFSITEQELASFSIYLNNVGNNNDIISANPLDYCTYSEGEYTCIINNQNIRGSNSSISILVEAYDEKGNFASKQITKTLTADNVKPEVNLINAKSSIINKFVKKEDNTLVMELFETGSGLNEANVFLNLNALNRNGEVKADYCNSNLNTWTCYWENIGVNGRNNGDVMRISRVGVSKDDAGNPLDGVESTTLIYDDSPPELKNLTIKAITESGERNYYESGDLLTIKAILNLDSGSSMGEAYANLSNLYNININKSLGDCKSIDNSSLYECSWETSPIKDGFYTADLKFSFSDIAGNTINEIKKIPVYGVITIVPDNFEVIFNPKDAIPSSINRLTASIIPNPPGYKLLIPFTLNGGGNNIEILDYQVYDCLGYDNSVSAFEQIFVDPNNPTHNPLPKLLPLTQANEQNFVELTLASLTAEDFNLIEEFNVNCSVSIYQRLGNHVYAEPEQEQLIFPIKFRGSALDNNPGDEIKTKINDSISDVLRNTQFITKMGKIMKKLQDYCGIAKQVINVWNVFASIEAVGAGLNQKWLFQIGCIPYELLGGLIGKLYYGKPSYGGSFGISRCGLKYNNGQTGLGGTEAQGGIGFQDKASKVSEALGQWNDGNGFPGLRNICGFVSCEYSTELADKINKYTLGDLLKNTSGINVGSEKMGSLGYVSTDSPNLNPQDSLTMSVATVCIPGVIYNIDKYRQIQCRYVQCLKETAIAGAPTYICEAKKSQSYCIAVFGEISETVGIFRLVKSLADQATNIAADILPNLLKLLVDNFVCKQDKSVEPFSWVVPLACDLPRAVYNTIDSWNRFKAIGKYTNSDSWKAEGDYPDACEEVLKDDFTTSKIEEVET